MDRRGFLSTIGATTLAAAPAGAAAQPITAAGGLAPQKISSVDVIELHGSYEVEKGVDSQFEVTPLAVYDDYQPPEYADKPDGKRTVKATALYLRIRCTSGLEGVYGPIDKSACTIVHDEIRQFLIGKDALAGEVLWDQMYRSNRHSRDGYFLTALSAVDNTLWDLRAKAYGVPVWRLLGGPSRHEIEFYASALGSSLQPDAVRRRATQLKDMGFRYQKWFMGYGPGSGEEGMHKNVELVKTLRETLGEDYEIMFDAFSGWDANYASEWAKRVEKYRPKWIEELTHRRVFGIRTGSLMSDLWCDYRKAQCRVASLVSAWRIGAIETQDATREMASLRLWSSGVGLLWHATAHQSSVAPTALALERLREQGISIDR